MSCKKITSQFDLYESFDVDPYTLEFIMVGNDAIAEKWVLDGMTNRRFEIRRYKILLLQNRHQVHHHL